MPQNLRKSGNIPLTKRVVDASLPREKRYHLWDSELRGFGLRVEPSGIKTFLARYRPAGGGRRAPERLIPIGRHGPLTPEDARLQATKLPVGAATGAAPAAELNAKRTDRRSGSPDEIYAKEDDYKHTT